MFLPLRAKWFLPSLALATLSSHAATIYMCKAYSGGTFWSSAHCNTHNALIERMVNVPDSLPFEQQVRLAEQDRAQNQPPAASTTTVINQGVPNPQLQCTSLDARVVQLDAMARQPQTGQMQDWIRAERSKVRDEQFRIGCR